MGGKLHIITWLVDLIAWLAYGVLLEIPNILFADLIFSVEQFYI